MIKVLFDVKQLYYWAMMKPIYDRLSEDDNYQLAIRVGENHTRFLGIFLVSDKKKIETQLRQAGYNVSNNTVGYDFVFCGDTLKNPEEYGKAILCHVDHSISIKSQRYRSLARQSNVRYLRFVEGRYRIDMFKKMGLSDNIELHVVGTPKLDAYFTGEYSNRDFLLNLGLDPTKKTVLYGPSYKPTSIFDLGKQITSKSLTDKYNVIIKLHPYSWAGKYASHKQHKYIQKCVKANPNVVLVPKSDHNIVPYLFAADTLISDASGVINEFLVLEKCGVIFDKGFSEISHSDGEPVLVENLQEWLADIFVYINKAEQLESAIETAINPDNARKKKLLDKKNYLCNLTDGKATDRIKAILEEKVRNR